MLHQSAMQERIHANRYLLSLFVLLSGGAAFAPKNIPFRLPLLSTAGTTTPPSHVVFPIHSARLGVTPLASDPSPDADSSSSSLSPTSSNEALKGLRVAVVGGGPSGLLLALRLGQEAASVSVFERRPRQVGREQRAYALGIGRRGRTALQSAGSYVWSAVRKEGFASERFDLHLHPKLPALRLRDERDGNGVEPSLLLFQSDLCRAMARELERTHNENVRIHYGAKVSSVDLENMQLSDADGTMHGPFDLIVGCDGVQSAVRQAMANRWSEWFDCSVEPLAGELKVAEGPMPSALDASAVALLVPASGSITAFVEPTGNNTACVLLAGRNASDPLLSSTDPQLVAREIVERFPKLAGWEQVAAPQLIRQTPSRASKVTCNTYHGTRVALVGDAAHATGGVSGQGVNSALVDSQVLADCLIAARSQHPDQPTTDIVSSALLQYSVRQVPEGKALYDLSFGPTFEDSPLKRVRWGIKSLVDAVFKGRFGLGELPLQTKLTTSLRSFADLRRDRQRWYADDFPSNAEWEVQLTRLHNQATNPSTAPAQASTTVEIA